jgi:hypothetical protein
MPVAKLFTTHLSAFALVLSRRALLQLQRLEAESRSHILTGFSEAWHGMATVRAYNQQAMFTQGYAHVVNRNGGAVFGACMTL